jgi:hypothetical protein
MAGTGADPKGGESVIITDVAWVRDRRDRQVLQLRIDGHPAHIIPARQRPVLIGRGIVEGLDLLASDWQRNRSARPFIRGAVPPELAEIPLARCTDDPRVLALYEEMCRAIAADTWRPGPRPLPS